MVAFADDFREVGEVTAGNIAVIAGLKLSMTGDTVVESQSVARTAAKAGWHITISFCQSRIFDCLPILLTKDFFFNEQLLIAFLFFRFRISFSMNNC